MKILFFHLIILTTTIAWSQADPALNTDRPGQAITSRVVGAGALQLQTGIDHQTSQLPNSNRISSTFNNVVRLGLSESFEINSLFDFRDEKFEFSDGDTTFTGVSQWQLGFRYNVNPEACGWLPSLGIQTSFRMKQVGGAYRGDQVAPIILLSATHNLSQRFSLTTNGGVFYDGLTPEPTYHYVLSLTQRFSSEWSAVYEFYGKEFKDQTSDYLGVGLAYLVHHNLLVDGYVSSGDNHGVNEFYASLGFSLRNFIF